MDIWNIQISNHIFFPDISLIFHETMTHWHFRGLDLIMQVLRDDFVDYGVTLSACGYKGLDLYDMGAPCKLVDTKV